MNVSWIAGRPLPLGVSRNGTSTNFAIVADTPVTLVIFLDEQAEPALELALAPQWHRTGDVWHVALQGLPKVFEYGYRVDDASPHATPQFVLDPYATAISGAEIGGQHPTCPPIRRRGIASVPGVAEWRPRPLIGVRPNRPIRR